MKKKVNFVLMLLCLMVTGVLIYGIVFYYDSQKDDQEDYEKLRDQLKVYQTTVETEASSEEIPVVLETEEIVIAESEETIPEKKESESSVSESSSVFETISEETKVEKEPEELLDFQSMWEINPDICAWIKIEGTKVDYPILQSAESDSKYLTTAVDGTYYIGGSIFTQATYNNIDFDDPVTVIYGHTMRSGTLFGQLQSTYSSYSGFTEHSEINIYLPDEVRYYTVFAAVPYENIHILDTYDFSKGYWYRNFFKGVFNIREFGAQFNNDIVPDPDDRVIILSTCLNEDSTKRFLVMAIFQDDIE